MSKKYNLMKEKMEAKGWFIGWDLAFMQADAWWSLPDDADEKRVLFNITQDIEDWEKWDAMSEEEKEDDDTPIPTYAEGECETYMCHSGEVDIINAELIPVLQELELKYYWSGESDSRIEIDFLS